MENIKAEGKKKIEEGNRLIAEFMQYDQDSVIIHSNEWNSRLKYHSSWDWLMPVVDKISEVYSEGEYEIIKATIFDLTIFNPIDSVWQAVVEFIKLYNQQSNKREGQKIII